MSDIFAAMWLEATPGNFCRDGAEKVVSSSRGGNRWGEAAFAIRGSSRWKHWRMRESTFESMLKRSPRDVCMVKGGRSLWIRKPCVALRSAEVMVITKSGVAGVRRLKMPRPPCQMPTWLMRVE